MFPKGANPVPRSTGSRMIVERLLWCFLILISFSDAFNQKDVSKKAFVFPQKSSNSYVALKVDLKKPLEAFTICLHVYSDLAMTRGYSIFSYATRNQYNDILLFRSNMKEYSLSVGGYEIIYSVPETAMAPEHVCTSWESATGIAELWLNGKPMVRKSVSKGYALGTEASIILGQDQDSFGGGFEAEQSFTGDIGDVNMWDFVLSPDEINVVFTGGSFSPNVLDWRELSYEVHNEVFEKPQLWCEASGGF